MSTGFPKLTGHELFQFLFVNIGFFAQIFALYFTFSLDDIKKEWKQYKCNPLYLMLLSGTHAQEDYADCVGGSQSAQVQRLMKPITTATSNLSKVGSKLTASLDDSVTMINKVRDTVGTSTTQLFDIFANVVTEYEKMTISVKEILARLVAILTTLVYIVEGSTRTHSGNEEDILIRNSVGHCFHPETIIPLQNGTEKRIDTIRLGDILIGGSVVQGTLILDTKNPQTGRQEELYKIPRPNGHFIYVTGSHYIILKDGHILVRDYPDAIRITMQTSHFCCLLTSDHRITFEKHLILADWEGYLK